MESIDLGGEYLGHDDAVNRAQSLTGGGGSTVSPSTTADYLRECRNRYYHEHLWEMPFPQVPTAAMLLVPSVVQEAFDVDIGVMGSEVDAMSFGVLDNIPLVHAPLGRGEIRKTQEIVRSTHERFEQCQLDWIAKGNMPKLVWTAMERNPELDQKDFDLVDTDIDAGPLEKRSMPSLSLLKRPLYTEIGLSAPDALHQQRLSRLIPSQLLQRVATLNGGQPSQLFERLSQAIMHSDSDGAMGTPSHSLLGSTDADEKWSQGVVSSFRQAVRFENHVTELAGQIAKTKLGLAGHPDQSVASDIAQGLWQQLFEQTSSYQQQCIWSGVCGLVSRVVSVGAMSPHAAISETREGFDALRTLISAVFRGHVEKRKSALLARWMTWTRRFEEGLLIALESNGDLCKSSLQITEKEKINSTDPSMSIFSPDFRLNEQIQRKSGRLVDPVDKRSRLPIFPLEVYPVFPSGYETVMEQLKRDKLAPREARSDVPLASRTQSLTQVVVQGVRDALPEPQACYEPHMLIGSTNLLVAEERVTERHEPAVHDLSARSYRASKNLVIEEYLHDPESTLSILLERKPDCFVYDFIGSRREYRRNAAGSAPPLPKYVVLFNDQLTTTGDSERNDNEGESENLKRVREE